jgi:pimeloyl-ACP methyl ester carboxylesterase
MCAEGAETMATVTVNGVRLFYELTGTGEVPLVLVHGSWGDHHTWDLLVPHLVEQFHVLTYDRRGHSQSERPPGRGSVREDVADLAALIKDLGLAPAWVVGNSFGASITLRLAGEHPHLLRGLIAHEPPVFSLVADDPAFAARLGEAGIASVLERIAAGDHAAGAEKFVETVIGRGTWPHLPSSLRQTMIENAPTFLDEENDPETHVFDSGWIKGFSQRVLLTLGGQSPPLFEPVIKRLAEAIPQATVITLQDAGHVPQSTHPDRYAKTILAFVREK